MRNWARRKVGKSPKPRLNWPNRAIRRLGGGPQGMANASSNSWDGIRWCIIGKLDLYEGMVAVVDRVKGGILRDLVHFEAG